ncbi:hypothetical protein B0H14DRAFT_3141068 [Mycena olivaceomarginata]|nr:hypothetical protein B0H14DRAFT_3141068 [Mycena olivaceomarginata]
MQFSEFELYTNFPIIKGSLIYNPSHYVHHLATTRIWETKVSPWVDLKRKDMTSEHMFFSALRRFGEAYLGVHCVTVIRGLAQFSIALHHSQNTTENQVLHPVHSTAWPNVETRKL